MEAPWLGGNPTATNSGDGVRGFAQLESEAPELTQDDLGADVKPAARFGRRDAPGGAVQEPHFQFALQDRQLLAQRWLGDADGRRGPVDAAGVDDLHKVLEPSGFHRPTLYE